MSCQAVGCNQSPGSIFRGGKIINNTAEPCRLPHNTVILLVIQIIDCPEFYLWDVLLYRMSSSPCQIALPFHN